MDASPKVDHQEEGEQARYAEYCADHGFYNDRVAPVSCGHAPSPHSDFTTGTAHTRDGREICWTCADAEQVADLKRERAYVAYLSGDGRALTTWTGGKLADVTRLWDVFNNFAGTIKRFRAVDVHGQRWYGTSPGAGMYARMHKCK